MKDIKIKQYGQWMPADIQTPISVFLGLVGAKQGILLESAEVDGSLGRYSIIAWNFALRLTCKDGKLQVGVRDKRFQDFKEFDGQGYLDGLRKVMANLTIEPAKGFEDLPAITRGLVGYFGYGLAGMFEPALSEMLPPENAESVLVLPGNVVLFDHLFHRLCFLTIVEGVKPVMDMHMVTRKPEPPEIGGVNNTPDERTYKKNVADTVELIRSGECIQTVLSTRFSAPFSGDPFTLYRRLRQVNPSPYMFYMRLAQITLLGSSPEMLLRCENGTLETCPIAGTRHRGANMEEDRALEEEMLADPKERAEHVMLVDLGRNDLGRVGEPGTVKVERYMKVERFSHVMHIVSNVRAKLAQGKDALDALGSAFPAGTLSGAPKVRAMEIIADMERLDRGPYGGAIGWLGLDKGRVDMDTGITIRSLWIRDGYVHWQAGAGIVFDSNPDMEWMECQNKAKVLAEVLSDKGDGDVLTHR